MSQKKKALTLTIPEPCSENFNKMTPVKGGKFCGSCEKTIVDFRTMSDGQILNFYKNNNGKICGVFNNVQLNRAMPFPMEVKPNRNWKSIAALAAGLMFGGGLMGQNTTLPHSTIGKIAVVAPAVVQGETAEEKDPVKSNRVIRGQVNDQHEQGALVGATILIKDSSLGTVTDIDGYFEITIPDDLTTFELVVSYTGYESQTLLFNEQYPIPEKNIEITLQNEFSIDEGMVMGIMIMDTQAKGVCEAPINGEIAPTETIPEISPDKDLASEVGTDHQMTIFPNPFLSEIKVSFYYPEQGDYLFHLYDVKGQLLFAKSYQLSKGKQILELDMTTQHLLDGVYILQISDQQDRILATKKVYKGQA